MMVALGTVFMVIGATFEVMDLTVCAMASLLVVFVYLEIGSYYPWLVWICTSLATLLLYSGSVIGWEYFLVFGIYPLIKAYIERLPRWSWLVIKVAYINAVIWSLYLICELLLKITFFSMEEGIVMLVITYILTNIAFVAFDFFISVMVRFYFERLRPKVKKFLK